jgi:hypothetical protein
MEIDNQHTENQRINVFNLFVGSFLPNWLQRRKEISDVSKILYSRLCQYAGVDGECFPQQETLADDIGTSVRTIKLRIQELVKLRLIEVKQNGLNKPNNYYFLKHEWMFENPKDTKIKNSEVLKMALPEVLNNVTDNTKSGTSKSAKNGTSLNKENQLRESIKKVFADDSLEIRISKYLFKNIQVNYPKAREPDFQKWAEHVDYMLRLDKITEKEIADVIQWIQIYRGGNGFTWKANILSTKTLREKFPTMKIQMETKGNGKSNNTKAGGSTTIGDLQETFRQTPIRQS